MPPAGEWAPPAGGMIRLRRWRRGRAPQARGIGGRRETGFAPLTRFQPGFIVHRTRPTGILPDPSLTPIPPCKRPRAEAPGPRNCIRGFVYSPGSRVATLVVSGGFRGVKRGRRGKSKSPLPLLPSGARSLRQRRRRPYLSALSFIQQIRIAHAQHARKCF